MWALISEVLLRIIANYIVGVSAQIAKELDRKREHEEALKQVMAEVEDLDKKKANYIQIRDAMQLQVTETLNEIGRIREEHASARAEKENLIEAMSDAEILRSEL